MRSVEKVGKSEEEAIAEALKELETTIDNVTVETTEEISKGLFGLLSSKGYRVKVTMKEQRGQIAALFLREMLVNMGVTAKVEVFQRKDNTTLNINGNDLGMLIGKRGQTLDSLQYLLNLVVNKGSIDKERIVVDVEGYRKRREETLRRLALKIADKVKLEHHKESLEPMSPHERRIIHATLQDFKEVYTYSEGVEPYRHIIVCPQENEG